MNRNWIKNYILSLGLFLVALLISIKLADIFVGQFIIHHRPQIRSVILRESSPYTDSIQRPTNDYIKKAGNLERKDYRFRTDADGFIIGEVDLKV